MALCAFPSRKSLNCLQIHLPSVLSFHGPISNSVMAHSSIMDVRARLTLDLPCMFCLSSVAQFFIAFYFQSWSGLQNILEFLGDGLLSTRTVTFLQRHVNIEWDVGDGIREPQKQPLLDCLLSPGSAYLRA